MFDCSTVTSDGDLLQQNEQLRDVIKEMRLEMEQLMEQSEPNNEKRGNEKLKNFLWRTLDLF